ncbi:MULTISPECIES: glycosyl hydrolase [unclassified Streptomyces]|uniref:glycosyl hydrolase n=1 Tax=unclassified Streptomyces TaxID=2593676 RepID=UPI0033B1EA2C
MPSDPVVSCSPQWLDLMNHAMSEAHRFGLDLTLHNCSDWSSTGTARVTPALSLRQMLWNETFVAGGKSLDVQLPRTLAKKEYYRDAITVAFPSMLGETRPMAEWLRPITANGQDVEIAKIVDITLSTAVTASPQDTDQPGHLCRTSPSRAPRAPLPFRWPAAPVQGCRSRHPRTAPASLRGPHRPAEHPSAAGRPARPSPRSPLNRPDASASSRRRAATNRDDLDTPHTHQDLCRLAGLRVMHTRSPSVAVWHRNARRSIRQNKNRYRLSQEE